MQCSLCQQTGNVDCMKRFCWDNTVESIPQPPPRPATGFPLRPPVIFPAPEIPVAREMFPVPPIQLPHPPLPPQAPLPPQPPQPIDVRVATATNGISNSAMSPSILPGDISIVNSNVPTGPPFMITANTFEPANVLPMPVENINPMFQRPTGFEPAVPMLSEINPPDNVVQMQTLDLVSQDTRLKNTAIARTHHDIINGQLDQAPDITNHIASRQGIDLRSNTLVDHPLQTIPGVFDSQVDAVQRIQFPNHQTLPETVDQVRNSNTGVINAIDTDPRPAAIDNIEIIPLSSDTLRQMIQNGEDPNGAIRVPVSPSQRSVPRISNAKNVLSATPGPAIPMANDVFGKSSASQSGEQQHTLVLRDHGNGQEHVGIVIGDTQPSNSQLSLLETSGQLPSDHPAFVKTETIGNSNTETIQNTNFIPISSLLGTSNSVPSASSETIVNPNLHNLQDTSISQHQSSSSSTSSGARDVSSNLSGTVEIARASMSSDGGQGHQRASNSLMSPGSLDIFPAGFVESVLSSSTPSPTINPRRKQELQEWGAQFIPSNI